MAGAACYEQAFRSDGKNNSKLYTSRDKIMKFLVAGLGMLGAHVVAQLHREGHTVEACDIDPRPGESRLSRFGVSIRVHATDVTDFVQVANVAEAMLPDYIVNTSVSRATDRPALMTRVNVTGLVNLLEAARIFKIARVVHASSTTIYGSAKRDPKLQEQISRGELISFADSFYGATKQAAEGIGHNYARHCGVDFVAIRFCHIFGGGSTSTGMAIENLVKAAVENRPAKIENRRAFWEGREDFVYVKDAAGALIAGCTAGEIKERGMNVSMGVHYTFDDIVTLVKKLINPNFAVNRAGAPDSPFLRSPLAAPYDTTLAQKQLGFKPKYDMEAAIRDFADTIRAS
jgi:UDP-glucose 4-epimerase